MKKLVLLLVFSAIALRAAATTVAPPAKVWDFSAPSTTGAGGADWLYAITQTSDGGYLAGGFAAIMGTSSLKTKASVLKLDPHRTVQWERLIGISGDPDSEGDIRAVLEAAPNLYIAAGDQHATGANSDGMIVTLDAAGTVLNKFVFTASQLGLPPNVNPVFYAIRSVPGGGYIVAGAAQEATPQHPWVTGFLLRLDAFFMPDANFGSNGVVYVEPASSPHKASGSDVRRVRLTHDSNGNVGFLAVGSVPRNISLPDLTDMLIETFNGSGVPQSRKTYSVADLVATGPFNDSDPQAALCGNAPKTGSAMAFDAAEMPNGDLVVLAHTNIRAVWAPQGCPVNSPLTQSYLDVIPVLVRMTPSLTLLWAKSVGRFSGIDFDTPMAMVGDGFVIAGNDATNANNNVPARVIKTNFSGDVTWQGDYIIPGNKNNCVFGLTSTFDDGVVFAGNNDAGGQDYFATKIGSLRDLWSSDNTSTDPGPEPDNATPALWASDDIWVHTSQDQWPYTPQHENPEYRDPSLQLPNFVYVRVRNRGTLPASGLVTVHWAKASTGLAWPTNWQQPTARCCSTNVICGDALQPVAVVGIPPGGEQIVELPWFPPNPADFSDVSCGLEASHFCLLARIETSPGVSPFGMTYPEGTDVYTNAALNNNIVWKNVTVVDNLPGGQLAGGFVRNISDRDEVIELSFTAPRTTAGSLVDVATVDVKLGSELLALWRRGGAKGSGIRQIDDVTIRITAAGATLQNIAMRPQQAVPYAVRITPKPKTLQRTAMSLDVTQSTTRPATNPPRRQPSKPAGGMRFTLKPPAKRPQ